MERPPCVYSSGAIRLSRVPAHTVFDKVLSQSHLLYHLGKETALIADLEHYDRWLPGSKSFGAITQIAPLPVGLGTTYIDAGPSGTRHGEVTEYDPPTRISFHQPMQVKQRLLTGTIDIHLRHTFEPVEQMTRLNRYLTLHIYGLVKVVQPFVVAMFRQENERMLLALKRYVEKGA